MVLRMCLCLLAAGAACADPTGTIEIRCEPGLRISMDRKDAGTSAGDGLVLRDVPVGRHLVRVEKPERQARVFWVDVTAGKSARHDVKGFELPLRRREAGQFEDLACRESLASFGLAVRPASCVITCETLDWREIDHDGGCLLAENAPAGKHAFRFSTGEREFECELELPKGKALFYEIDVAAKTIRQVPLTEPAEFERCGGQAYGRSTATHLEFSPDGTMLACTEDEAETFLWTLNADGALKEFTRTNKGFVGFVGSNSAVFQSRDVDRIDLATWEETELCEVNSRNLGRLSPDGSVWFGPQDRYTLAAHSTGDGAQRWRLELSGAQKDRQFLEVVAVSGDGTHIFTRELGVALTVRSAATGKFVRSVEIAQGKITCGAAVPGSSLVAVGTTSGAIAFLAPDRADPVFVLADSDAGPGRTGHVGAIAVCGDRLAVAGGPDGLVRLWDLTTRRRVASLPDPVQDACQLAFSRDGIWLAVARPSEVQLWKRKP